MNQPGEPKSPHLRAAYWREEILQVMFWIEGEGFGDAADVRTMERFLGLSAGTLAQYLARMVDDGLLLDREGLFSLSEAGRQEGSRVFAEEFADLTRPAHGECGPDCWCHSSVEEAEACASERAAG